MNFQIITVLLALVFITVSSAVFTVEEGRQAFITEFGKIRGEPITKSGLHFKMPFIQDVRTFDKRILQWDGDAEQIPTKDKKYIWVDTTARWRIKDVIRFAQTVQNERTAANRLDGILDGVTRDMISSYNLVETVRNSNLIIEKIDQIIKAKDAEEPLPVTEVELGHDDITGEIERITTGREELTKKIIASARVALEDIGIELLDVQLRRVSYEESVEQKVYERMITERQKIAARIRSFGQGEAAKISGRLNLKLKEIESEAYRKAQEIKGQAEAIAIKTYADAFSKDANFYAFQETLNSYQDTLKTDTNFILSSDSPYLRALSGP
ncbi:MAG: protease modulator HflC [Proteobacteria bacterium]|nr:protease modulator HflC [Pseudomonadota bacterium]